MLNEKFNNQSKVNKKNSLLSSKSLGSYYVQVHNYINEISFSVFIFVYYIGICTIKSVKSFYIASKNFKFPNWVAWRIQKC